MKRENQSTAPRPPKTRLTLTDWVFLRKIETLIFAFMFLALPFFALKVVYTTTSTLSVRNTVVDLVRDLINWQKTAREKHVLIKLESKAATKTEPCMYRISQDDRTLEEVRFACRRLNHWLCNLHFIGRPGIAELIHRKQRN